MNCHVNLGLQFSDLTDVHSKATLQLVTYFILQSLGMTDCSTHRESYEICMSLIYLALCPKANSAGQRCNEKRHWYSWHKGSWSSVFLSKCLSLKFTPGLVSHMTANICHCGPHGHGDNWMIITSTTLLPNKYDNMKNGFIYFFFSFWGFTLSKPCYARFHSLYFNVISWIWTPLHLKSLLKVISFFQQEKQKLTQELSLYTIFIDDKVGPWFCVLNTHRCFFCPSVQIHCGDPALGTTEIWACSKGKTP